MQINFYQNIRYENAVKNRYHQDKNGPVLDFPFPLNCVLGCNLSCPKAKVSYICGQIAQVSIIGFSKTLLIKQKSILCVESLAAQGQPIRHHLSPLIAHYHAASIPAFLQIQYFQPPLRNTDFGTSTHANVHRRQFLRWPG